MKNLAPDGRPENVLQLVAGDPAEFFGLSVASQGRTHQRAAICAEDEAMRAYFAKYGLLLLGSSSGYLGPLL